MVCPVMIVAKKLRVLFYYAKTHISTETFAEHHHSPYSCFEKEGPTWPPIVTSPGVTVKPEGIMPAHNNISFLTI